MPLKRWFAAHDLPPWYSWLVVIGLTVASNVLTLVVVTSLSNRAVENERSARVAAAEESRAATERSRRGLCLVIESQEGVFSDATTPVGRRAAEAWHDLGEIFRCEG
jgi:hypothetical protein